MFNQEFFPTPPHIIELMCEGLTLEGKTILEPSAGKGDIVDFLKASGSTVLACENNKDLSLILESKCSVIGSDFLELTSDKISHINAIVMNPPFSKADKHILHAYSIAPAGCVIVALCNYSTIENKYTKDRESLGSLIDMYGLAQDIGNPFEESERYTKVRTALVRLHKAGGDANTEFDGFFMDEEPEESQADGMMKYNFIRDVVNRYVEAVKIFDEQLSSAVKMSNITSSFYSSSLAFHCTSEDKPVKRNEFKKDLQKSAWKFIFSKMDFEKFTTKGLKEDINKFVEQQTQIPFTMRNIYKMLEIVIGTTEQRMDKALLEVFDSLTERYHDNRMNLEGWKTNSHFLVNRRFIFPYGATSDYSGGLRIEAYRNAGETLIDLEKALCFMNGVNYDDISPSKAYSYGKDWTPPASHGIVHLSKMEAGQWYDTHFFRVKAFKKGTIHCEFKDVDIWGRFNQRIAKIKGFPLFEYKKQTAYQDRQTGRKAEAKQSGRPQETAKTLFEIKF